MLTSPFYFVRFDEHDFLEFYYKTIIILSKIASFQVRLFEKNFFIRKFIKKQNKDIVTVTLVSQALF